MDERLKKVIYVNEDGNLVIPKELSRHYGLEPGVELVFEQNANTILLQRPITHLARIDIEPTNNCNLTCSTCIRNVWDAPTGWMKENTYRQILAGVKSCDPIPTIFFGGYGEPLSHPGIIGMIQEAKALGARVELITNGTLLNEECIHTLIDVGLDFLWVSIDGASSAGYADVRLEDALSTVKGNIENLHRQRLFRESQLPQLGLSFVAMKKNIEELTDIVTLGIHNDARKLSVSNVLPHTEALKNEMLYERSGCGWRGAYYELQFPRFDISDSLHGVLRDLIFWFGWNGISGNERERRRDRCPFVARGSMHVRWDGNVSPCQPLMYSHVHYLGDRKRENSAYTVGSVNDRSIQQIWRGKEYMSLRERLSIFDFSPCTECNSCEQADTNKDDCFGNDLPACGGCLWAQGFVRCP